MNTRKLPKILVVDDRPENIELIISIFEDAYEVLSTTEGEKAVEISVSENPDLILLDVMMPGLDGYEVCRRLKADPLTNEIPVIFITGLGDHDAETRGLELGAVDFVSRPFHITVIERRVKNQIELKTAREHLNNTLTIIRQDLSIAKKIQNEILYINHLLIEELNIFPLYIPMSEVGGDYYDVSKLNEFTYRIFLADATGHGVQAALITMAIKGIYDNLKDLEINTAQLMEKFNNEYMNKYYSLNSFMTAIIFEIDIKNHRLEYTSAGHPAAALIRKDVITPLKNTGIMIGIIKNKNYRKLDFDFRPGDRLFLFTDGIFEEFNSKEEEFGLERLFSIFLKNSNSSIVESMDDTLASLDQFLEGAPRQDDITILGIEYKLTDRKYF